MEWLWNAFWAKIGWVLGEVALGLAVFLLVFLAYVILSIPKIWKQSRCPHPQVNETSACHAICRECGKDLGFIGTWREKQRAALQ